MINEIHITKENYYIYYAFYDLYKAIKENKPYYNFYYDNDDKNEIIEYNRYPLFKDNKITFISDDGFIEDGSSVTIEMVCEDTFRVLLEKGKIPNLAFYTNSIRISNSGIRYTPLNIPFMNMYNNLKEYDFKSSNPNRRIFI